MCVCDFMCYIVIHSPHTFDDVNSFGTGYIRTTDGTGTCTLLFSLFIFVPPSAEYKKKTFTQQYCLLGKTILVAFHVF